ncbi:MAG: SDR family NAD(P)-dependent oxidoreductase [Vulcanimicrobiaceae bacterium]
MSELLADRVALVTGGARGIGAAIVTALIDAGAHVVVADNGASIDGRSSDPSVAGEFAARFAGRAIPFGDDLASDGAPARAVGCAVDRFGGLDIIVNNAAIVRDAFVFKADLADYDAVLRTNLVAAFAVVRAAAPVLREQAKANRGGEPYRFGRIVNIVSTAGIYGNFGQAAYASSKAGLIGLTRVAAHDLARSNVTVNAVAPFAATRVTESIVPQTDAQAAYKAHALRIDAAPVGRFIAYLASDAAAALTGQLFGVRGDQTFLFSQPRPVARFSASDADSPTTFADRVGASFSPYLTPLETDLDAFAGHS